MGMIDKIPEKVKEKLKAGRNLFTELYDDIRFDAEGNKYCVNPICDNIIVGRKRKFCNADCFRNFCRNFSWNFIRDSIIYENNICQKCKIIESKAVHHIKQVSDYPELQLDRENLIALCLICHRGIHFRKKPLFRNKKLFKKECRLFIKIYDSKRISKFYDGYKLKVFCIIYSLNRKYKIYHKGYRKTLYDYYGFRIDKEFFERIWKIVDIVDIKLEWNFLRVNEIIENILKNYCCRCPDVFEIKKEKKVISIINYFNKN